MVLQNNQLLLNGEKPLYEGPIKFFGSSGYSDDFWVMTPEQRLLYNGTTEISADLSGSREYKLRLSVAPPGILIQCFDSLTLYSPDGSNRPVYAGDLIGSGSSDAGFAVQKPFTDILLNGSKPMKPSFLGAWALLGEKIVEEGPLYFLVDGILTGIRSFGGRFEWEVHPQGIVVQTDKEYQLFVGGQPFVQC